jgi:hypothetical protein
VSGQLQTVGDDGPERCAFCSNEAAGPCASCRRSVCGNCCTLTEGSMKTWAICLECDRKKGRSLRSAWLGFGGFFLAILAALAAAVALLGWLSSR